MTNKDLQPIEFLVSLDDDPLEVFKGKQVNIVLTNPHQVGEYHIESFSMLKLLIKRLNELKPAKKQPSDADIEKRVREIMLKTEAPNQIELYKEIYSTAFKAAQ